MNNPSHKRRVAVIGAGVGGLSAAALLSSRGYEVVVFDQAKMIGGKAGVVFDGETKCDTGPSLLTMKEEIEMVFEACGEKLEDHLTLRAHNTCFRYVYPDEVVLDVYDNFETTIDEIKRKLGSQAALELTAFLTYSTRIWDNACPHFVLDSAPSFWNTFKKGFAGLKAVSKIDALDTMKNAIDTRISSRHLRHLLYRYATYTGSDPAKAPATLNCIAHVELNLGGYGIEGGMHQLPKALYRIAKNNGTMFRMGSLVEKINTHNNKVVSLSHAAGNDEPFDFVVSNADTRHLYEALCPEANPRRSPQSESARSTSAYNMLWHDPDPTPQRAPHTVLFPVDYEDEFKALFERRQVPRLPAVYLCDQTLNHGTQHPAGGHIVFGMINAPEASLDDDVKPSQRAFETKAMIAKNRKYLSTDSQVLWQRTPQDLAERFPDSGGALYGPASNNWKSAFARAGNHSSKVKGLFIASGTAHPGGGVPMAMLSGWHAANQLHQQFPLPTFQQGSAS